MSIEPLKISISKQERRKATAMNVLLLTTFALAVFVIILLAFRAMEIESRYSYQWDSEAQTYNKIEWGV